MKSCNLCCVALVIREVIMVDQRVLFARETYGLHQRPPLALQPDDELDLRPRVPQILHSRDLTAREHLYDVRDGGVVCVGRVEVVPRDVVLPALPRLQI